jgi:hypothetical protein
VCDLERDRVMCVDAGQSLCAHALGARNGRGFNIPPRMLPMTESARIVQELVVGDQGRIFEFRSCGAKACARITASSQCGADPHQLRRAKQSGWSLAQQARS